MSQSESTKNKILQSAVKIFAEKGYWKTKVSDIVTDAGFSQGSFYNCFSSKEECFKEILLSTHNETIQNIEALLQSNKGKDNVSSLLKYLNRRFREIKDIAKVFIYEAVTSSHELRKIYQSFKTKNFEIVYMILKETDAEYAYEKAFLISGFIKNMVETLIIEENVPVEKIDLMIENIIKIICKESV